MRAILIVAYRRKFIFQEILESCKDSGISDIYIHIDGPKTDDAKADVDEVIQIARKFATNPDLNVRICVQPTNIGCASSLIVSCDQLLDLVNELLIFEDDCVPSKGFWDFSNQGFSLMKTDRSIGLLCGSQFAPQDILASEWLLSSYPFHWGWGINSERWSELRKELLTPNQLTLSTPLTSFESRYWNAGSNRALNGLTDVWDTLFVREMFRTGLKALLPPVNLVKNKGADKLALHTSPDSLWTNFETEAFPGQLTRALPSLKYDDWARSTYFKISRRHLISTRINDLLNIFKPKKFQDSLATRVSLTSINFS